MIISSPGAKYCDDRVCMSVCSSVCPLAYLNNSLAVAEMGDRLAIIDIGRKVGAAVPRFFLGGELGHHLTQCGLDRGLPPYQVAP